MTAPSPEMRAFLDALATLCTEHGVEITSGPDWPEAVRGTERVTFYVTAQENDPPVIVFVENEK